MVDSQHEKNVTMCLWEVAEAVDEVLHGEHDEGLAKDFMYLERAHARLRSASQILSALRRSEEAV